LRVLREQAGVADGQPVPRLKGPEVGAAPKERYETEMAFFMETEDRFYQDMYAYLKPFPNDYAAEGIPILAAYGALQDWDAIMMYTFEPKLDPKWQAYVGDPFDISLDRCG
jgi:hypothetical protein